MAIEELLPSRLVFGSLQLLVTVPLLLLTLSEAPRVDPFRVRSDLLLLLPPWGELQLRVTTASLLLIAGACVALLCRICLQDIRPETSAKPDMRGTSGTSNAPVMESGAYTFKDWSEKVCPECASEMGDSAPLPGGC